MELGIGEMGLIFCDLLFSKEPFSTGPRVQKCQNSVYVCPILAEFSLVYHLVHSIGSMKPDIVLNLSLANIPLTVCLLRYPSFS